MLLTFGPGVITLNVSVPIVDDDLVEVDEMFYGNLCFPQDSTQARVEFAPDRANATITDNDSKLIIILQIALLITACFHRCCYWVCENLPSG